MEGRSSSAMLRTTPMEFSTSFLISSAFAASTSPAVLGADHGGQVGHLHQHAGERLAHFVVQFARDGAALVFLRLHQARRELLRPRAKISPRWSCFQAQNLAHAEAGQQQSEPDGQAEA